MTLDQFLDALGKTPRKWRLMTRKIRCGVHPFLGFCPLEAVNNGIALEESYACAVVSAADDRYGHDPALRAALLQRTGLAEPKAQKEPPRRAS